MSFGKRGERLVNLEIAVRSRSAGMHHAFGNALAAEVRQLFGKIEVLKEAGTTGADAQCTLIVGDSGSLVRGQPHAFRRCPEFVHILDLGRRVFRGFHASGSHGFLAGRGRGGADR